MARYIYEWKGTEHGNRLFRRPSAAPAKAPKVAKAPAPAPEPDASDYTSLKKDELVEAAEERGLDTSGTKADIIERLEADDGQS